MTRLAARGLRTLFATGIAWAVVIGCVESPSPSIDGLVVVPGSSGDRYAGVTWSGDQLVVATGEPEGGATTSLAMVDPTTGSSSPIAVPAADASCVRTDDYLPSMSDVLRWIRKCELPELGVREIRVLEARADGAFSSTEGFESRQSIHGFAASDVLAVASIGNRICETIVDLMSGAPAGLPIEVEGPGGTFSLATVPGGDDCRETGVATMPAVLGERWAFLASTTAIGKDGLQRLDQSFDVYVVEPGSLVAARTPVGLRDPAGISWLDDEYVLTSGVRDGTSGTWMVHLVTGEARMVFDRVLRDLAVSPDAERLAGTRAVSSDEPLAGEIVVGSPNGQ